jgi:hypothetical protein
MNSQVNEILLNNAFQKHKNIIDTDIDKARKVFKTVLKDPQDFFTFKVTRKPEYHNGHYYELTIINGRCQSRNKFPLETLGQGTFTTFTVCYASTRPEEVIKRLLLEYTHVMVENISTSDSFYRIFVKHREKECIV